MAVCKKDNTLLAQTQTQAFPLAVENIRLWKRYTYDLKAQLVLCYTVATKNNCIQANYKELSEAEAHYNRLVKAHEGLEASAN